MSKTVYTCYLQTTQYIFENKCLSLVSEGIQIVRKTYLWHRPKRPFKCYVTPWWCIWICIMSEGVWFNVISVTRWWGVQFPEKTLHNTWITLNRYKLWTFVAGPYPIGVSYSRIWKVLQITGDVHLTDLIRTLLESRRFFVALNGKKSRWRRQRNGLPQGSVLAPMLFNIYTNDQPVHADTHSFIYADNLCIASQGNDFNDIEASLTSALNTMTT